MSEDAARQEAETELFDDELSDEALDRLPIAASSVSCNPCGPSPSKSGAVVVPTRQT